MSDVPPGSAGRLPHSHYFITVARGASCCTVTVRTGAARLAMAALVLTGCWTLTSSLYLALRDDLVAAMMVRDARAQDAYEDRIAALRSQLGSAESRRLVSQNRVETDVRALALRAAALETRAALVTQAMDRAGLGPAARDARAGELPGAGFAPSGDGKPHPEAVPGARVSELTDRLDRVEAAQNGSLAGVGRVARRDVAAFRAALAQAGLSPGRFGQAAPPTDSGGPFVPLGEDLATSVFGRTFASLQADVAEAERLRATLPRVPFASPLAGPPEVTSPFGARLDPFLGRPALHTGVDLREALGTEVRATADGKVVGAGAAGGYGLMVEVEHGSGLATRYAHLSAVTVAPGDRVTRGQVIGQVGSTGRATGPHLHYETRIDGEAVDPMRFLDAGQRLAAAVP